MGKVLGPTIVDKAFLRLSNEDARDYEMAKREILNCFQLDSRAYFVLVGVKVEGHTTCV